MSLQKQQKKSDEEKTKKTRKIKGGVGTRKRKKFLRIFVAANKVSKLFAVACPSNLLKQSHLIATDQELWLYGRVGASRSQQTC